MSTISLTDPKSIVAEPALTRATVPVWDGERRILFQGVDWHTYDQLCEARGEGNHVLLIYDGKDLEIMVVGNIHELLKGLLATIVRAVAAGRNMDFMDSGQATWQTKTRGLEADLSYYFEPEKVSRAREGLSRRSMNQADFPYPDLAIEIDMSPSKVDRPSIYRDLNVPRSVAACQRSGANH